MKFDNVLDLHHDRTFFELSNFIEGCRVYLKLEGFNFTGSIKLKTAYSMIEGLEQRGIIQPGRNRIIESSSGNLGIALSLVCKEKGYAFSCVVDPNAPPYCLKLIKCYGGEIIKVTEQDENGGYLQTRIRRIQEIVKKDPATVWANQYANKDNALAHYKKTGREIHEEFPNLDYLFVGTGSTGTLVGCSRYFKEHSPGTKVIAVDPEGSITFGSKPAQRLIPGLGASRIPEIASRDNVADVLTVAEEDTIRMCRSILVDYSLFVGPSTATVLHGVKSYREKLTAGATLVVVSPDLGDKYIDTVYNPEWVEQHYRGLQE